MPAASAAPSRPDLANVQGLVVHSYPQTRFAILLFRIEDVDAARGFIREMLPQVARGDQDPAALHPPVVNLGLTWGGLALLLAGDPEIDSEAARRDFDWAFTDQTPVHPAVSGQLGFLGGSSPSSWWGSGFSSADVHLGVYLACGEGQLDAALTAIRGSAAASGLHELQVPAFAEGALAGYRPAGGILHFGVRDGVTSHKVDWDGSDPAGVNFREFVVGYPSDDYPMAPHHEGPWRDFARDGSFACIAWVHQDVAAYQAFLAVNLGVAAGRAAPGFEREWIAAKLLGRWPEGSPLVRHPQRPPAVPDLDDAFGYAADPDGHRCPLNAHIRVVQPRDEELTYPNQVRFPAGPPRLMRRGFTYGPPLEGSEDDGRERGIVGTFLCARVNEQFYTVLRWIQKTDFAERYFRKPYAGTMQDALFGSRDKPGADTRLPLPAEDDVMPAAELAQFITYRGVLILFLPSLTALARLAREERT